MFSLFQCYYLCPVIINKLLECFHLYRNCFGYSRNVLLFSTILCSLLHSKPSSSPCKPVPGCILIACRAIPYHPIPSRGQGSREKSFKHEQLKNTPNTPCLAVTNMADMKQELKSVDDQQNYSVGNEADPKNMEELTQYVQTLLQGMQDNFQTMSEQIITRNEMGSRIDDLEKNIADLMTQAGVEGPEK